MSRVLRHLALVAALVVWFAPTPVVAAERTDPEVVTVELDGPYAVLAGEVATFLVTATSTDGPVAGLAVEWHHAGAEFGEDDSPDVPESTGVTGDDGRALHDIVLYRSGTVTVRAVVRDGSGVVLLDETRTMDVGTTCHFEPARCSPPYVQFRVTAAQGRRGRDRITAVLPKGETFVLLDRRNVRLHVVVDGVERRVGPRKMFGADRTVTWAVVDGRPYRRRTFVVTVPYGYERVTTF